MHHEKFQKLEGSWRGLHHLVMNSETGTQLKIRVTNLTKRELFNDLTKAVDYGIVRIMLDGRPLAQSLDL